MPPRRKKGRKTSVIGGFVTMRSRPVIPGTFGVALTHKTQVSYRLPLVRAITIAMPSSSKRDHKRGDGDDEGVDKEKKEEKVLLSDEIEKEDRHHSSSSKKGNRKREDERSTSRRHKKRTESRRSREASDDDDEDDGNDSIEGSSSLEEDRKRKRHKKKKSSSRKSKKSRKRKSHRSKKRRKRSSSSDDSSSDDEDSDDDSSSSSSNSSDEDNRKSSSSSKKKAKLINEKLLVKLQARGETLEERKERRSQKRAAKIQTRFGYTAEENPFNDPNLHETFTWTKKKEKAPAAAGPAKEDLDTLQEIDTIRQRRKDRDAERDEMERLRAEESRMKELENYDEWARKEEEFHLEQQRKRSAIRLVEGREKPIDVLAKNLLLFGLTDEEKNHRAAVKYKERYNALDQLAKLEAELEEPHKIVQVLKLAELQELLVDIDTFRMLEREGMSEGASKNKILLYWDALRVVARDEVKFLQNGGDDSPYAKKVASIKEIFAGQSKPALIKMGEEIDAKLAKRDDGVVDKPYWGQVKEQLVVHFAKGDLSEQHSKMLVRQLERLELRKEELARQKQEKKDEPEEENDEQSMVPNNVDAEFGNREDELGETDEVALESTKKYSWQDRYAPRKPRYFNRVKTGYDWNKYNQSHYDHDNPPPKTVQGYKFNIFYPDLVDPTKTPQFFIESADSNDFCILRFHAGPPYEDCAFKIINRAWNRSRKRGFKCTFERGVLSLYFNFESHWYRR